MRTILLTLAFLVCYSSFSQDSSKQMDENLNNIVKEQKAQEKKQKRKVSTYMVIGVGLLGVLIIGLNRKKAKK